MEELQHTDSGKLTYKIATAVASAVGTDPDALDTPLYESVDTEALERVLDADTPVCVRFQYEGYIVEVDSDRTITVDGMTPRVTTDR